MDTYIDILDSNSNYPDPVSHYSSRMLYVFFDDQRHPVSSENVSDKSSVGAAVITDLSLVFQPFENKAVPLLAKSFSKT